MGQLLSSIRKPKLSKTESDSLARTGKAVRRLTKTATASRTAAEDSSGSAMMRLTKIERAIMLVRGEKVILAADLARLYGVTTKRLNEQVRRNIHRFPGDFMLQLTWEEADGSRSHFATLNGQDDDTRSRSQSVTLKRGSNVKYRPYAFTEHGAIMAATVLNSARAVQVSVYVVRAFVQLRRMLAQNKEVAAKLRELERKVGEHDQKIVALIGAIRELMAPPPEPPRKMIGFESEREP